MNPFEWKKAENCFGAAHVYEYRLAAKVDEALLNRFAAAGTLTCHRNFPRPFFQAVLANGISFKGVIADSVIKVSFPDGAPEAGKQQFDVWLAKLLAEHMAAGER